MEMQVVLQVMKIWVVLIALSVHGSADPAVSPESPSLRFGTKGHAKPVAEAPRKAHPRFWPTGTGHSPSKVPFHHNPVRPSIAVAPSAPSFPDPAKKMGRGYAFSPSVPYHKHHHGRNRLRNSTPKPSYKVSPAYSPQGSSISPSQGWLAPSPSPTRLSNAPIASPAISPLSSSLKKTRTHPPAPVLALPPPPPNQNCASVTCPEPLTYAPPGLHCGCVMPIQVKLHLSINLYTFFPLVSELAKEIAASLSLNHSQVRIMGANEAKEQLDKTAVLVNLVPLGGKFGDDAAFSTYKKFFHEKGLIKTSLFGAYEVLYVRYPGLPPSPPSSMDRWPYSGSDNGRTIKPLGVEVPRMKNDKEKKGISKVMVAVIVISCFTAFVMCLVASWLLLLNCGAFGHRPEKIPHALLSSPSKPSGSAKPVIYGSKAGSSSIPLGSSALAYTGSAKTFTLIDIERATNKFDASRIVGEGGFGIVYRGVLDDGREVAVKVLKREDQRGGREFLSEVEMLGRLHHRNLVKLIAICTEGHIRCLVYELVPNGSVESHLHGVNRENGLLDWDARVKIALGAARGLAYLHEDSSPPVIHRDFKSSNILLEHDFTPKVSDFGLARAAHDEGNNKHISTRVMGTFGYLAPEYAMTGHLLVKSDVYSYGVVLLELLTGRKPVDLSQPPGQENLVAWAHPLLTNKELLETIIDPALKLSTTLFDSISKVAAIASMCVQPEVSNRPFMGEVVQALQLVRSENDEKSFRQELVVRIDDGADAVTFDGVSTRDVSGGSSSGGVGSERKMGRFWERLRGGSISESEHESSHKLWPGSD